MGQAANSCETPQDQYTSRDFADTATHNLTDYTYSLQLTRDTCIGRLIQVILILLIIDFPSQSLGTCILQLSDQTRVQYGNMQKLVLQYVWYVRLDPSTVWQYVESGTVCEDEGKLLYYYSTHTILQCTAAGESYVSWSRQHLLLFERISVNVGCCGGYSVLQYTIVLVLQY